MSRYSMRRRDPLAFTWTCKPEGLARGTGAAAGNEVDVCLGPALLGVGTGCVFSVMQQLRTLGQGYANNGIPERGSQVKAWRAVEARWTGRRVVATCFARALLVPWLRLPRIEARSCLRLRQLLP